jgi:hypothetical protein
VLLAGVGPWEGSGRHRLIWGFNLLLLLLLLRGRLLLRRRVHVLHVSPLHPLHLLHLLLGLLLRRGLLLLLPRRVAGGRHRTGGDGGSAA